MFVGLTNCPYLPIFTGRFLHSLSSRCNCDFSCSSRFYKHTVRIVASLKIRIMSLTISS